MNVHHRRAFRVLGAVVALDVALGSLFGYADHIGTWHGLYCATGFATTDGCDAPLHGWLTYVTGAIMMLTMIPLVGVVWAYVTTGLTADHIDVRHEQLKDHVSQAYEAHEQPPGAAPPQPPGPGGGGGTEVDGPRAAPPPGL